MLQGRVPQTVLKSAEKGPFRSRQSLGPPLVMCMGGWAFAWGGRLQVGSEAYHRVSVFDNLAHPATSLQTPHNLLESTAKSTKYPPHGPPLLTLRAVRVPTQSLGLQCSPVCRCWDRCSPEGDMMIGSGSLRLHRFAQRRGRPKMNHCYETRFPPPSNSGFEKWRRWWVVVVGEAENEDSKIAGKSRKTVGQAGKKAATPDQQRKPVPERSLHPLPTHSLTPTR